MRRRPRVPCGQCDGGLIPVNACTCGSPGGPEGHERYCGWEPCANGCWEVLHPPGTGLPAVNLPAGPRAGRSSPWGRGRKISRLINIGYYKEDGGYPVLPHDPGRIRWSRRHSAAWWIAHQAWFRVVGCRFCHRTGVIMGPECDCKLPGSWEPCEAYCGAARCPRYCPMAASRDEARAVWRRHW